MYETEKLEEEIEKLRSYLSDLAALKQWDFKDAEIAGVSAALDQLLLAYEQARRAQNREE